MVCIFVSFVGDVPFKMPPITMVTCCLVSQAKEGCDVPYGESMCVCDKLPSDTSYMAVGCELNVNESTVRIT